MSSAGSDIAVIGGVAAGMSAASKARRQRPDLSVTVFERGPHVSYGACGIPYNIGDPARPLEDLVRWRRRDRPRSHRGHRGRQRGRHVGRW